jgi:hypothetical protein
VEQFLVPPARLDETLALLTRRSLRIRWSILRRHSPDLLADLTDLFLSHSLPKWECIWRRALID